MELRLTKVVLYIPKYTSCTLCVSTIGPSPIPVLIHPLQHMTLFHDEPFVQAMQKGGRALEVHKFGNHSEGTTSISGVYNY